MQVTLLLKKVTREDEGVYRCVAFDNANKTLAESTTELKLTYMGNITSITPPKIVDEGSHVQIYLECTVEGYPTPYVSWKKIDSIQSDKSGPVQTASSYQEYRQESDQGKGIIFFNNITVNQGGRYECIASNGYGLVLRKETHVLIKTHGIPFKVPVTILSIGRRHVTLQWRRNSLSTRAEDESYNITYTDVNTATVTHIVTGHASSFLSEEIFNFTVPLNASTSRYYEINVIATNAFGSSPSKFFNFKTVGYDCFLGDSNKEYRGKSSWSYSGTCLPWNSSKIWNNTNFNQTFKQQLISKLPDNSLSEASNYCRNPYGESSPWCYAKGRRNHEIKKGTCPFIRCDYRILPPLTRWVRCTHSKIQFALELPVEDTGFHINISCKCNGKYDVEKDFVYYYYSDPVKVFSVDYSCGSHAVTHKREISCHYYIHKSGIRSRLDRGFICIHGKTDQNASRVNAGARPHTQRHFRRLTMIMPEGHMSVDRYSRVPAVLVTEGAETVIGCRGRGVNDKYIISIRKDDKTIASTLLTRSSWRTGPPYYPRMNITASETTLTLNVTFELKDAGSVFSCYLDERVPWPVKVVIHVLRKH